VRPTRRIALITVLTALSVASNYALSSIPNVNLMDAIVMVSGALYGLQVAIPVAVLSWAVYGTLNPYGFCLPILMATMSSELVYAFAGRTLRNDVLNDLNSEGFRGYLSLGAKLSIVGCLCTLMYDFLTNMAFAAVFAVRPLVALIQGVPFSAMHVAGNSQVLLWAAPAAIKGLERSGLHEV